MIDSRLAITVLCTTVLSIQLANEHPQSPGWGVRLVEVKRSTLLLNIQDPISNIHCVVLLCNYAHRQLRV